MAFVTGTAFGNNLTRIAWSSKLHRETQDRLFFQQRGMVRPDLGEEDTFERGKGGSGAPIVSQEALNGKRAQEVRVGLANQLTTNRSAVTGARSLDAQTYGTGNMIDNEETPALRNFIAYVEQMKHAASFDVPEIQDLRTEFKLTAVTADLLADWMAAEIEESILDACYDQHAGHVVAGVSSASVADPPANNLQYANNKGSDGDLTSGDELTSAELRRIFTWADVNNINPLRYMGQDCWILLCHSYNYADLNGDSEFREAFQHGWQRAEKASDNPLFDMADAKYMGLYIHKYNRIRASATNANARRCIVLGADAIAEGITYRPHLARRKEDRYGDLFGLAIKAINGWGRADYAPQSGATLNQSLAIWGIHTSTAV